MKKKGGASGDRANKVTIDVRHNEYIKELQNKQRELPRMRAQLEEMETQYLILDMKPNSSLTEEQLITKLKLGEDMNALRIAIRSTEDNKELRRYIQDAAHLLYHYYDNDETIQYNEDARLKPAKKKSVIDFFVKDKKTKERQETGEARVYESKYGCLNEVIDKYISVIDPDYIPSKEDMGVDEMEKCPRCNAPRIVRVTEGLLLCPACGRQEKFLVDSDIPSYKEPPREITYFAYKRINHFNEWLAQFQAKETTDIDAVYDAIKEELSKEPYLDESQITHKKIREVLKKLEMTAKDDNDKGHFTKYYEHAHYIANRITGRSAPLIDADTEEELRHMFKEIQAPWEKFCPDNRNNFMSYSFVLYKFLELKEKDEYLKHFGLLKSREHLAKTDALWKKICEELKWEYIKTI
jgi:hypothetical protein